jgi:ABC-type multidrug transport system ATPase subunit
MPCVTPAPWQNRAGPPPDDPRGAPPTPASAVIEPAMSDAAGLLIETRSLTERFGARNAADAVDLSVPRGCAFGFLGPGAIVEEPRFVPCLTGRQNLRAIAAAREPEADARIPQALERVGLARKTSR